MGPQARLAPSLSLGSLNPFLGSLEGLPWEPGDLMLPKSEGGRCQRRPSCFRTGFLDPHHPWGVLRTDTLPCGQPGLALCPGDWVQSLAPATGKDSRALWLCRCMSPNLPANPRLSQFLPGEGSWWELGASEFTTEQSLSNEEAGATQGPQGGLGAGASKVGRASAVRLGLRLGAGLCLVPKSVHGISAHSSWGCRDEKGHRSRALSGPFRAHEQGLGTPWPQQSPSTCPAQPGGWVQGVIRSTGPRETPVSFGKSLKATLRRAYPPMSRGTFGDPAPLGEASHSLRCQEGALGVPPG